MKRFAMVFFVVLCCAALAQAVTKTDPPVQDKANEINEPYWNPNPGYQGQADVPENESVNNACPGQAINCGDVVRPAALTAGDNDYFYFYANAGDVITVGTDADGSPTVDTFIHLLDASCFQLAQDDDSGPGTFSLLNFCAQYTGAYVLRVRGFSSTSAGVYKAFVTCSTSGGYGDNCTTAGVLPCGNINLTGNTGCSLSDYTLPTAPNSCTGFTAAGRDQVLQLVVNAGAILDVTYTSTADASIYVLDTCSPVHCIGGADATLSGQPEHLVVVFATGGTYYLILDSFGTNTSGAWTLTGTLDCGTVAVQPVQWTIVKTIYR